ncbi:hypothetical protein ACFV80_26390 [Streptomyces sp. NPDC059862]|uniref:hypothetical protein n=1 Tax=Streptomyces sp. NPDC059862 TaxID=3346975 RepID=UPI00365DA7E0
MHVSSPLSAGETSVSRNADKRTVSGVHSPDRIELNSGTLRAVPHCTADGLSVRLPRGG